MRTQQIQNRYGLHVNTKHRPQRVINTGKSLGDSTKTIRHAQQILTKVSKKSANP